MYIYLFIQIFHILYYLAPLFQVVWIRLVVCYLFYFRSFLRPFLNSFSKDWVGFDAELTAQVGL